MMGVNQKKEQKKLPGMANSVQGAWTGCQGVNVFHCNSYLFVEFLFMIYIMYFQSCIHLTNSVQAS